MAKWISGVDVHRAEQDDLSSDRAWGRLVRYGTLITGIFGSMYALGAAASIGAFVASLGEL